MITEPKLVQEELVKLGRVDVYVEEFRITHGYLRLRLTGQRFHDVKALLHLGDCGFVNGKMLVVDRNVSLQVSRETNQDTITVFTDPEGLTLRGLHISLEFPLPTTT